MIGSEENLLLEEKKGVSERERVSEKDLKKKSVP